MDLSSVQQSVEVTQREIAGSTVKIARWRADADRRLAFSNDVEFLLVTDWQDAYFDVARLVFIAPYSKACSAMCRYFDQACYLTKELRPPLLILLPQNLILGDDVHEFASLLQELPELRVVLYSGWAGVVEHLQHAGLGALLDSAQGMPRIELAASPCHPKDFHATIARHFGLSQAAL